jgi:type IV secretory pathway TraG/TraD family ATPase VirD4
MKCLRKYQWVKLPRDIPDIGKGLMAYWAMLASRAAFRKGNASYCGHSNPVAPGMWAGGVVGLKSILGVRSRAKALQILDELSSLFFSFLFIKLTRFADLSPGGRCPVPVNLILDEFNNIGRIGGAPDGSDFCRSPSVIRSRDIRVMLAVQSLGQLQNRYPNNLWSEIIGNCDIQLMLGCTDDVTADYISDRSGEMCIVVNSTMTVKKTVAVAQVIPQYRETQGQRQHGICQLREQAQYRQAGSDKENG